VTSLLMTIPADLLVVYMFSVRSAYICSRIFTSLSGASKYSTATVRAECADARMRSQCVLASSPLNQGGIFFRQPELFRTFAAEHGRYEWCCYRCGANTFESQQPP
jgi:hypothetical protein